MRSLPVPLLTAMLAVALAIAGCSPTAPAPTPTKAPAAPTKGAEPTKPPAATAASTKAAELTKPAAAPQPTAAPAKKVAFPEKGKTISIVVPSSAGGGMDLSARLLAPLLEKELGTPVQVVGKPGAGHQVGLTELALAKPDGYTLGYNANPSTISTYLDPERKAVFNRKSFETVAGILAEPTGIAVMADSPYKSTKDLVDAAKANPEKIKIAASGLLSSIHITVVLLERAAGVKLAPVHFDGAAPTLTALLGRHVDAMGNMQSTMRPYWKDGTIRVLGIATREENDILPGAKTFESQGYKVYMAAPHGINAPAGTPKEIVDILTAAIKTVLQSNEVKAKYAEMGVVPRYQNPAEWAADWDAMEADIAPIIQLAKR